MIHKTVIVGANPAQFWTLAVAYNFTGGRISHFPIDSFMGLTTVLRYCAACDCRNLQPPE